MNNFPLRLPPDVEAAIRQLAKEHDRTVNKEIVQACKAWIQAERKPKMQPVHWNHEKQQYEGQTWSGDQVTISPEQYDAEREALRVDGMPVEEREASLHNPQYWIEKR